MTGEEKFSTIGIVTLSGKNRVAEGEVSIMNKEELNPSIMVIGSSEISDTQQLRVSLVEGNKGDVRIAVQKWWRGSNKDEWKVGKGLHMTSKEVAFLKRSLDEALSVVSTQNLAEATK